ncbi:MAG: hypothetical protein K2Y24_07640 [Pseudomonadaceae bacterium]|nr:hypothetical protein [Pseudomonadaceae bacterium]
MAEFLAVVRDPSGGGYYKVVAQIGSLTAQSTLTPVFAGPASIYAAKLIDLNGFTVRLGGSFTANANEQVVFSRVQFRKGCLVLAYTPNTTGVLSLFYRCALEDCAVQLSIYSASSSALLTIIRGDSAGFPEPARLRRVVFMGVGSPTAGIDQLYTPGFVTSALTVSQCYARGAAAVWSNAGLTRLAEASLGSLDGASGGAFTQAGWWDDAGVPKPWQTELVALTLLTRNSGVAVSRRVYSESSGQLQYCGETGSDGAANISLRIRLNSAFTLFAAEDMLAEVLADFRRVSLGDVCLPPQENGFVYLASATGSVGPLAGVVFTDQPVTVNGITFTPRPQYQGSASSRRSVSRYGAVQSVVLDNAGGGGPVIDGDPAYLAGIVEEIHPAIGSVRALAGAEVFVFERRGSDFVAQGSAYSNGIGEFLVNTDVYGGGDVFAFAADFPGVIWQAGIALNIGARVRPTVNNGYVYEIITAGNSGATEPMWWADEGDGTEGSIGGATAKARPYYQPVGHGPLKMTFVE